MTERSSVTDEQRAVAEHPLDEPGVVDAGAGTGKTHTIINRVAYLYEQRIVEPKHIVLLTFARKAAAELRRRVLERLGSDVEPPQCSTFHAFASSVLSAHAYDLDVSPDAAVIEDIDARLEFRAAFEEVVYGGGGDASAFPLRPVQRDSLRDGLFAIAQGLKEREISIERFLDRAVAAAEEIERIRQRVIRKRSKDGRLRKAEAETTDEALRVEAQDARSRARAAAEVFRRYDARLRQRHALTYPDLLLLARRGIAANPALARELTGRYRLCIVDEFQDTDQSQWRFLETLFGSGLERVTVVGDPRQSIFGFRGAVPENVSKFRALPRSRSYQLTENRRSRQEILDLAHAIIAKDTHDERALRAHRGRAGAQNVHVASRWATDREPMPNADECRQAQAAATAARIAHMLAGGRAPNEIAILTRNKTLVQPFGAALRALDIPFRLLGGAGFYETPEVRDALAWLRVLADPLDGQAVARLCASPACGLSDAATTELAAGLEDDDTAFARRVLVDPLPTTLDADSRARIERLRAIVDALEPYSAASLSVALPAVFAQTGIVAAYAQSGDRQAVANVRKLRELASDFQDRNRGALARDFVHYIDEIGRVDFDDREADWPASDAVTIMTVHAAKGLEWPVVFVIDVWPPKKPQPLIWLDHTSGALLCREGRDDAPLFHVLHWLCAPDDDGFIPHEDERDSGPSAEERRLFYVALTRARDEVHVLGPRRYSAGNPDGVPHLFVRETQAWIEEQGWRTDEPLPTAGTPARQLQLAMSGAASNVPATRQSQPASLAQPVARSLPPLSYSVVHAYERCPRSVTYRAIMRLPTLRRERTEDLDDALADAAALDAADSGALLASGDFGRLVHRALERWARSRIAAAPTAAADAYVDQAVAELQLRPKAAERARAIAGVEAAIASLAGWQVTRAEAPFSLQYDDVVVTGYIDLIACDPSGRATIVDYKTGDTRADAYALQLAIYRDAALRVYGLADAACAIGRFDGERFALEPLAVPAEADVRMRIRSAAAGLRNADVSARPGDWCWTCEYRAAPCDAYPKRRPS